MKIGNVITLITFGILSCQLARASEGPSYECLASYSRSKGFNEPDFDAVNYDHNQEDCVKAIASFAAKVRSDIIEKMVEVSTEKKQSECITGKFTNDDTFVNNIIKGEALAALDEKEKSTKLLEIEKFAEEFITTAITTCFEFHEEPVTDDVKETSHVEESSDIQDGPKSKVQ